MNSEKINEKKERLLELTGIFCTQKLNNEYYQLCEKLILKLSRKRDVPFQSGKLEVWAAGVIHAIGSINFLFDKSSEPYVTISQLNEFFGTKKSTTSNRSRQIRKLLNLNYYDANFSTQNMLEDNPFDNMVLVDGFIVSLSTLPENIQKMVKKERSEGRDVEFTTRQK